MSENEIMCVGLIEHNKGRSEHIHKEDFVYCPIGISRCLIATDYKSPMRILVRGKHAEQRS